MAPRIDHYDWDGGREALLRFGPDTGPLIVAALPLFEEANRTRTFAVGLLRALAVRGMASVLPDIPGQGDSTASLAALTIPHMASALQAATSRNLNDGRRTYALGIRSGTLLDHCSSHSGRWQFAPQTGASVLRDLHRTWRAAGHCGDCAAMMSGDTDPVEIAGNLLSIGMLSSLSAAIPFDPVDVPLRVLRLTTDPLPADRKIDASPLWRRAEPGNDPVLIRLLADDIAEWIATCEA